MRISKLKDYYILLFLFLSHISGAQDNSSLRITPRLCFYSCETDGEILFYLPAGLYSSNLPVNIEINGIKSEIRNYTSYNRILRIPVNVPVDSGIYKVRGEIISESRRLSAECDLIKLPERNNEVKTDRLTGGMIVNQKPFFPFGFYCYTPVHPTLPEEEVVRGFNMMSPYQKILPQTLAERRAYMDRCAQLGMKVHYNLLSVAGGGGVNSKIDGITPSIKKRMLAAEVREFMNHPALLAWYIADEPNGYRIPPDTIKLYYDAIKAIDPWHPVSIVFMAPFTSAKNYAGAMDIVMADPYPVPDMPVTMPGNVTTQLMREFGGKKTVWMVPQAFGGGELWLREPTPGEIRLMTYHSIINGATGIQYFVRQGLNLFPKSPVVWAECSAMAIEIAELTPWLLSDEPAPEVACYSDDVQLRKALHNGILMIMVQNKTNKPTIVSIRIANQVNTKAHVLFENRDVQVAGGSLIDHLSSYGSQVYMITLQNPTEKVKEARFNLLNDPGFEELSNPGIPSALYARNDGDRGATYFTDTRDKVEGNHSVRLVTPSENKSVRLRFYPVSLKKGGTYYISAWGKADKTLSENTENEKYFEVSLGEYGTRKLTLTSEWKEYVTNVTIPADTVLQTRVNLVLRMPSSGTGWFDMVQVFEGVDIIRSINPALAPPWEFYQ